MQEQLNVVYSETVLSSAIEVVIAIRHDIETTHSKKYCGYDNKINYLVVAMNMHVCYNERLVNQGLLNWACWLVINNWCFAVLTGLIN